MLAKEHVRDFSMPRLARALSVGVMSLYTYFPSKDALLLALADDVYNRMAPIDPQERWQDYLYSWLWTVVRHLDRHPEAIKLMQWSGHVSPGWLQRWFPVAQALKKEGLRGPELAFAMSWFTTAAMGFISAQLRSPENRRTASLAHLENLDLESQRLATGLWLDFADIHRDDVLSFGFRQLISGVEQLLTHPIRSTGATAAP
ncbi:putative TetR family transcriptional regulator [Caenibius tardaugens NBRC 16725]|uniref:Putative TetR family transcriptional regulator n=2 Tax=Caenibius TaxID=2827482 RepID=U2ZZA4_9SPHN|nr:putative TetR family transcriptional regulator [Caenibius tardaugens NBRC 16725]